MKSTLIASILALASISFAAPSPNDSVKINQALASYAKITSFKPRAADTLSSRAACPEAGSGEIDPCCFDGGPDDGCRSVSNCYERCGPTGPDDIGGPLGCIGGCASVCPSEAEC
ncbi:hypothetical protein ACN47E_002473 [Coniothyrium glycines]